MNIRFTRTPYQQLTRDQVQRILLLEDVVWPKAEKMARPIDERIDAYFAEGVAEEVLIIEAQGRHIAQAELFPREIQTAKGPMTIMGLASVCTDPDRRGEGWGKRIALEAFKQVDNGRFAVSLFQTRVPEFYEKLGARRIDNSFRNSLAKEGPDPNPWWNPHRMIYPGSFIGWPEGEIDLLGPAW